MRQSHVRKMIAALLITAVMIGAAESIGVISAYADTSTGGPPVELTPHPDSITVANESGGLESGFAILMTAIEGLLLTV